MTTPEAYIRYSPDVFTGGEVTEVTDDSTRAFLTISMAELRTHIVRVLTVIPRPE